MYENAKLCNCYENGTVFFFKCITNNYDFRKLIHKNICRSRHVLKNGRNIFFHMKSSKIICFNFCSAEKNGLGRSEDKYGK